MNISRHNAVCLCFQRTFQNAIIVRIIGHDGQTGLGEDDVAHGLQFFNDLKSGISGEAELGTSEHIPEFVKHWGRERATDTTCAHVFQNHSGLSAEEDC